MLTIILLFLKNISSLDAAPSLHFSQYGSSRGSSRSGSPAREVGCELPVYRVVMLGSQGVGKSAICSQLLSSDHVNTYESVGKYLITA